MSIVTPPRNGIVLGTVKVQGQELPVTISDEYMRWITSLMDRVGGIKSIDLDELAAILVSPVQPQPQEPQNPPVIAMDEVIQRAEEAARMQVAAALAELQPQPDNAAEIASLRESINMSGNTIKRIIEDTITIGAGTLTETYVVSPGISGLVELSHLGQNSDDNRPEGALVSLTRSGDTITATRNLTGFTTRVAFQLKEYNP